MRLEWAAVLTAAVAGYLFLDGSWQLFVLLILAPDLAMLGYLAGLYAGEPILMQIAAIWTAHIAMDRALGYGLKLPTGFTDTHLGRIGKER
jgi:hypothetical protein